MGTFTYSVAEFIDDLPEYVIIIAAVILIWILIVVYIGRLARTRRMDLEEKTRLQEELEIALKKAREANDTKSKFIANISHEIRTPLNAIIGLSSVTLDAEGLDKEVVISLERIYSSGVTIMSIVNDLLDLSKMEAGKYELVNQKYDVPDLINDVLNQNVTRIGSRPIEFILNIDENLPASLIGDELRVRQIFNNLLSNAFKFTREGLVILDIGGHKEDDVFWMTVEVQDTGVGIREEDLPAIFDDYFQVTDDSDPLIHGTGLGLPISKTLAEMMGGSLSAESVYGKGSLFTAKFKQTADTDKTISPEIIHTLKYFDYPNIKRKQSRTRRRAYFPEANVLVVDDVPINLDVMKGFLKPYKMHVDCAENGQQAIDAIRDGGVKYDAIFMDHILPDISGIEATKQIRNIDTDYAKNIPIIAFTANTITGNEEMFLDAGFQDFISKPITLDKLDKIIQRWIGTEPFIDGLDIPACIVHFGGDKELFYDTLRSFVENVPGLVTKASMPNEEDLTDYTSAIHSIKGACLIIYESALAERAKALEAAGTAGDVAFIQDKNDEFLDDVNLFANNIETFLSRL